MRNMQTIRFVCYYISNLSAYSTYKYILQLFLNSSFCSSCLYMLCYTYIAFTCTYRLYILCCVFFIHEALTLMLLSQANILKRLMNSHFIVIVSQPRLKCRELQCKQNYFNIYGNNQQFLGRLFSYQFCIDCRWYL